MENNGELDLFIIKTKDWLFKLDFMKIINLMAMLYKLITKKIKYKLDLMSKAKKMDSFIKKLIIYNL